jgi:hypothetical protein
MQKYGDLDSQGVMGAVNNLLTAFATNFQTLNNAAGQTLTVAQTVNVILLRSGAAAVTDTTPTAAAIVASMPNVGANDVFHLSIINTNTGTLTIGAGAGVTLAGTTTIPTVNTRRYIGIVTNPTAGSEAVTLRGIMVSAN